MRDFFERLIRVDDIIVYPVRQGSRLWIEKAKVYDMHEDTLKIEKSNGNKTRLKNVSSCIIAPPGVTLDDGS